MQGAHVALLDLEELADSEIARYRQEYRRLAEEARAALRRGERDTGAPDIRDRYSQADQVDLDHAAVKKRNPA